MMLNPASPTPNLTQLLQYSPDELSSGVLIADWIQSTTLSTTFEFDLSQIEREPNDSVTKYLNWVCLNAKVFNNFGILLNSSQINNFIEGKATEIYIILKQLHDKIRERIQPRPSTKSTKSAPSPSVPTNEDLVNKILNINKIKSTTAISSQKRKHNELNNYNESNAITPNKRISSILMSPKYENVTNIQNKCIPNYTKPNININFPSLSLAISPTNSHDRIEKVRTSTNSNTYTNEQSSNPNSSDIATSSRNISTIKEQQESNHVPNVDSLSLLSPDLNDVISTQKTQQTQQTKLFRSSINNERQQIKMKNPTNVLQQFEDYIIYDEIKLFEDDIDDFLNEKEKLEEKLNDAMSSYQSNNVSYLNNIVEQYRTQKLKICQEITDQQSQNNFLKKLQNDLEILDESLKKQFEESKKTLYDQLTAIHHKRLKEFAIKLSEKEAINTRNESNDNIIKSPPIQLETSMNINNQNINIPMEEIEEITDDNQDRERDELNMTLKQVSNLLEQCWKNEINKQQKQRSDKQKEIETLKEILSVYQNLSKLIQLQSNTLKTTIIDFENLCNENNEDYNNNQYIQQQQQQNTSIISTENTSPDKIGYKYLYQVPNNTQIQLLSSSDMIQKHHYPPLQNEEHLPPKISSGPRKKRRKNWNKKSTKNSSKTPAFSFEYNRQTVSSHNKKVNSKKKVKKSKKLL